MLSAYGKKTSETTTKPQANKQKQRNKTKSPFDNFSYQDINENINQPFRKILHGEIFI